MRLWAFQTALQKFHSLAVIAPDASWEQFSRLLYKPVYSPQAQWGHLPYPRLKGSEHLFAALKVPNGVSPVCNCISATWEISSIDRHQGCLSTCLHFFFPKHQWFLWSAVGKQYFHVVTFSFWHDHGSLSLHQDWSAAHSGTSRWTSEWSPLKGTLCPSPGDGWCKHFRASVFWRSTRSLCWVWPTPLTTLAWSWTWPRHFFPRNMPLSVHIQTPMVWFLHENTGPYGDICPILLQLNVLPAWDKLPQSLEQLGYFWPGGWPALCWNRGSPFPPISSKTLTMAASLIVWKAILGMWLSRECRLAINIFELGQFNYICYGGPTSFSCYQQGFI